MKKLFSVFLAVMLVTLTAFSSIAASENTDASYEEPLVIVRGIAFSGLTVDAGTENEHNCIVTPDACDIVSLVFNLAKTYFTKQSLDVDAVIKFVDKLLGSMACDVNGDSVYNVSAEYYPTAVCNHPYIKENYEAADAGEIAIVRNAVDYYGEDNVYYFTYDWRLDPSDTADALNAMIEQAKADHCSDKIDLICCSMGGIVTDYYLYEYGCESIDSLIFNSSTFCGTHVTTDLFQGKVLITADMLENLVRDLIGVDFIVNILSKIGIFEKVANLAMNIVNENKEYIYENLLRDTFATMPALWALVQPEDYEKCVEYMFPTNELKERYAGLIERTAHLNDIMAEMDALILSLPENGVKVSVVASYNTQMIPVYDSAVYQSDGTLESDLMLGRATVSETGKTLGDNYTGERVSPDNCVDLSNVLFPEYTWAIKDGPHVLGRYDTGLGDFIFALLGYKEQPTVDTFSQYPQFMIADRNLNIVYFK